MLCSPENAGKVGLGWVVLCCLVLTEFSDNRMGEKVNADILTPSSISLLQSY